VIGVFDDAKNLSCTTIIWHNYEISYEFLRNVARSACQQNIGGLASESLKTKIAGPDYGREYPQRLAVMDKVGGLLVKYTDADT